MSTLAEQAAANAAKMNKPINPSVAPGREPAERKRIPMSLPMLKLEVPEIPGYHLHWMRGDPARLVQAERAGYEFVDEREVDINNTLLGGDATKSGNTDLGSRVSVIAGAETGGDGQPIRLYLMKQKQEWYEEDQKILEARNASLAETLTENFRRGTVGGKAEGETSEDVQHRYVNKARTKVPDLFTPKKRRA